jgi:FkbM family methyltransferase
MSDFSNQKEIQIIQNIVNKNNSSIDLGANVGIFTKVLAECSKHVYALEPDPENFRQLQENMKPYKNVSLYNMAASNITGFETLHRSLINNGMHRLYESVLCFGGSRIQVKTIRVDDLIIEQQQEKKVDEKIDFIKMDVEGFEYFVIVGMLNLIERDKPVIISEFHPDSIRESGANPERIFKIMTEKFNYNYPKHCITGEILNTYEKLERVSNDPKGGVNILWEPKI